MRGRVDLLQGADGDLRIDLRRADIFVAEDRLDVPDVGPVFVHQRRHRVAQQVTRSGLPGARRDDAFPHRPRQMVAAERLILVGQEHAEVVRLDGEFWPRLFDV